MPYCSAKLCLPRTRLANKTQARMQSRETMDGLQKPHMRVKIEGCSERESQRLQFRQLYCVPFIEAGPELKDENVFDRVWAVLSKITSRLCGWIH